MKCFITWQQIHAGNQQQNELNIKICGYVHKKETNEIMFVADMIMDQNVVMSKILKQ